MPFFLSHLETDMASEKGREGIHFCKKLKEGKEGTMEEERRRRRWMKH